ncbi:MAG: hypothetical protein JO268_14180 [Pseudonocardiales bacterium]|nr:hypothetical protein [Pseudonocardiales bacterium]
MAGYDTESYSGLVQTHSDHLLLPPPQCERLVEAVRDAITRLGGGRLEYRYRTVLLYAHVQ